MSVENILSVRNITKTYPGVIALQNISMDFKKGEIHALVGENGAGKSTLIKVIAGAVSVDKGHVYFEGELQEIQEPLERRKLGFLSGRLGLRKSGKNCERYTGIA